MIARRGQVVEASARQKKRSPLNSRRSLSRFVRVLRAHLPEIRERYGVKSLGVFGSYLRGDQKPRSDFDVLVEYVEPFPATTRPDLKADLTRLLGVKVDLIPMHLLKPYIGKHILAEVIWLLKDGQPTGAKLPRRRTNGKGNGKMANVKREYLDYLNDILTNMEMAQKFCQGYANVRVLYDNPEKVYAVSKAIENIGEAVKKVPMEVRDRYSQVPWRDIAGMRDKLVHDYFEINYTGLWEVVTESILRDKPFVQQMIAEELARRAAEDK